MASALLCLVMPICGVPAQESDDNAALLPVEEVTGEGVWCSPVPGENSGLSQPVRATVWFDRQFLGSGDSYGNRAKEFQGTLRRTLRDQVVATLKDVSDRSYQAAAPRLRQLLEEKVIQDLQRHWIVNGFTCDTTVEGVGQLKSVPGVKKIFLSQSRGGRFPMRPSGGGGPSLTKPSESQFDPDQYKHPWYIGLLKADRVWSELGINGAGTLNIVHDGNFVYPANLAKRVYWNPAEIADNGIDDDKNGLIDDAHGYNFDLDSPRLTMARDSSRMPALHGTMCAAVICGTGAEGSPNEFGIAPGGRWAGVIARLRLESAVEWAVEHHADTYSMSFSRPNLGEMRSHWRKIMEHGSYCGVYFVSGAGNFALKEKVPVQMRTPEDIPNAVFAAAGVQRDLSRTPFSSKGPVEWKTEHYKDGLVQKPEVCAFNFRLPLLLPDGSVRPDAVSGNSFAGPMFAGSIALMLSADPDLLPWDLMDIITSTATDVGPPGVDYETGHGLINCYRAVKEVLRRKALREGK